MLEGAQGGRLAAEAIERDHEQAPAPFPQWVGVQMPFEMSEGALMVMTTWAPVARV